MRLVMGKTHLQSYAEVKSYEDSVLERVATDDWTNFEHLLAFFLLRVGPGGLLRLMAT